jgi:protein-disulfide isomerase
MWGVSSREDRKRAAREAREEVERKDAASEQRRRRLTQLGGIVLVAAAIVAILIAVSSGGGSGHKAVPSGGQAADAGQAPTLLGGIPQSGLTLGKPSAPVTIVEFNDMQCPVCREYDAKVFPTLIDRYVRTGKLRMEMRLQSFIGPDSVTAGKAVAAAAAQNHAWSYEHLFYVNQATENTGYVTDDFLRSIGLAVTGLDVDRLMADRDGAAAARALDAGTRAFNAAGFSGTPSFFVGRTGGPAKTLAYARLTPDQFTSQINALLSRR